MIKYTEITGFTSLQSLQRYDNTSQAHLATILSKPVIRVEYFRAVEADHLDKLADNLTSLLDDVRSSAITGIDVQNGGTLSIYDLEQSQAIVYTTRAHNHGGVRQISVALTTIQTPLAKALIHAIDGLYVIHGIESYDE